MEEPLDPVNVSALNQYAYCPRRCALIYLDGEFQNNIHTERGNAEHARVDRASHTTSKAGAGVEYALPVWHDRLGLIGKCDVVEFWPDGTIYPVEYKHGRRKQHDNDDLQLAAQALCLEEMFERPVTSGAIFHASSKRRREVSFDAGLRQKVEALIDQIRALIQSQTRPPGVNDKRCGECSMRDICLPQMAATTAIAIGLRAKLFDGGSAD
ncbi:MAG: CRISPR-associated protein Cas4 [Leptothrix sp. (in: b-proteobacteria)]